MKKSLLLIATAIFTLTGFSQTTLIPDPIFEQALIDLGHDTGTPDGEVLTANISSVTNLVVDSYNISDLTGIEDFTAIVDLDVRGNSLSSINLSNNVLLFRLRCENNVLTALNVTKNIALKDLWCYNNKIEYLDLSKNTDLKYFNCTYNELTCLNVKSGNNTLLTYFRTGGNSNLTCIEVDDPLWADANWSAGVDVTTSFSNDCNNACVSPLGITEESSIQSKIYPNPTNTSLTVNGKGNILIYDIMGNLVYDKLNLNDATTIDVSNLSNGIYYVKLSKEIHKLIIQN